MSGVGFLTLKEKSVTLNYSNNRPSDVSYFNFCSSPNPRIVDPRAPNTIHQFIFSLHLLQNSLSSSVKISVSRSSVITNPFSGATFDANLISPPYHEDKHINRYKIVDLSKLNTGAENIVKKRNQNNINNTNYTNKKELRRVYKTITAIKTKINNNKLAESYKKV